MPLSTLSSWILCRPAAAALKTCRHVDAVLTVSNTVNNCLQVFFSGGFSWSNAVIYQERVKESESSDVFPGFCTHNTGT